MKILWGTDYDDMIKFQAKLISDKARLVKESIDKHSRIVELREKILNKDREISELRKSCQCRECKHFCEDYICDNRNSDNYKELMNPYGSCEKCERR